MAGIQKNAQQRKERNAKMQQNDVIALIVILLFVLLAAVGFVIYAMQNHVLFFSRKRVGDEEE
ncbi:hypothetical protein TMatcc_005586 [Talaromyces marneffei ATCC 18224]